MAVIDETMGATFIGVLLAATMYGVTCVQIFYYYNRFENDWWYIKALVAFSWVCDTVHQALISHTLYTYLVTNYGEPAFLGQIVWSLIVEVLFNGFVAVMVQSFYMSRIYRLSGGNIPLTALVGALIFSEFGCVIAYTAKALPLSTFEQLTELKSLSMTVNALAAAGDIVIAASLCIMLQRSRTGFKKSDTMINRLIIFSVNTGLLTSICALLSLIMIAALPNTFIYICFFFLMGRLYSNSLLATLNVRHHIREAPGGNDSVPLSVRDIERSNGSRGNDVTQVGGGWRSKELEATVNDEITVTDTAGPGAKALSIRIDTTKEHSRDNYSSATVNSQPTIQE